MDLNRLIRSEREIDVLVSEWRGSKRRQASPVGSCSATATPSSPSSYLLAAPLSPCSYLLAAPLSPSVCLLEQCGLQVIPFYRLRLALAITSAKGAIATASKPDAGTSSHGDECRVYPSLLCYIAPHRGLFPKSLSLLEPFLFFHQYFSSPVIF